jgi:hypothetical protein
MGLTIQERLSLNHPLKQHQVGIDIFATADAQPDLRKNERIHDDHFQVKRKLPMCMDTFFVNRCEEKQDVGL